jgi:hypothetical protein
MIDLPCVEEFVLMQLEKNARPKKARCKKLSSIG